AAAPPSPKAGKASAPQPPEEGLQPSGRLLHPLARDPIGQVDSLAVEAPEAAVHHHAGVAIEEAREVFRRQLLSVDGSAQKSADVRRQKEPARVAGASLPIEDRREPLAADGELAPQTFQVGIECRPSLRLGGPSLRRS